MSKKLPKLGKAFEARVAAEAKRSAQKARLLVDSPAFQEVVAKVRDDLDIPPKGLKPGKAVQAWEKRLLEKDLDYLNDSSRRFNEILKKYPGTKNADAQRRAIDRDHRRAPLARLQYGVIRIVRKLKLGPAWQPGVKAYLLTNRIELLRPEPSVIIEKDIRNDGMDTLSIRIRKDTRLRDVKAMWPLVEFHQSKLRESAPLASQLLRQYDRDKRAYQLRKQRLSYPKIADQLPGTLTGQDVEAMIRRYKKRIGIS